MSSAEYLAFIPLLLYGLGISEILEKWKRYLLPKYFYLPYVLLALALLESGIYAVWEYLQIIPSLSDSNYFQYLAHLLPPLLYFFMCKVLTPDSKASSKDYLTKRLRPILTMAFLFLLSHWFYAYGIESILVGRFRILMLVILFVGALFPRPFVAYLIFASSLIAMGIQFFTQNI